MPTLSRKLSFSYRHRYRMIKVCGMRDAQNIREVEALGIDWMGFIFWKPSKRYCAQKPEYLPENCKRVGVFVNAEIDEIVDKCKEYRLDLIQLHGKEDRAYVIQLRRALAEAEIGNIPLFIKAFALQSQDDLKKCDQYVGFVDYFLFDTPTPGYGGSGKNFDWSMLETYTLFTPFLLSGGIGPDSADLVNAFNNPFCAGIDLNSKFESAPGLKDVEKLKAFIPQVRKTEQYS